MKRPRDEGTSRPENRGRIALPVADSTSPCAKAAEVKVSAKRASAAVKRAQMYRRAENWGNTAILLSGPTLWWRGGKDCWGNPYCDDSKSSHTPPLAGTGNNVGEWLDLAAKADC